MFDQVQVQKKVLNHYEKLKEKNPSYSIRSFSQRLGVNSGALSQILNGKRSISETMAHRLLDGIGLSPLEKQKLLQEASSSSDTSLVVLENDRYRLVADWQHFAILALVGTKGFQPSVDFIAERLQIPKRLAKSSVERLERVQLLDTSKKPWRVASLNITTSDHTANLSLRQSHQKNLELAARSLEKDSVDVRDFVAITVSTNPKKIKKAKTLIRKFRDELSEVLGSGHKTEVYKLCMQLIPLTQMEN